MGNSCSTITEQQAHQLSLPHVLRVNLDSDFYKNPVPKSYTVSLLGHKTEISHPHARVVQQLPLHELRDDKTTYVFRLTGAGDEGRRRTSLQSVRIKVDNPTRMVGFRCTAMHPTIKTEGGYELASGDAADLAMWNEVRNGRPRGGELLQLPAWEGFIHPLWTYEFVITMKTDDGKKGGPVVYADLIVEELAGYFCRQGSLLKPRFARADIAAKKRTGRADIGWGATLLAFVVVKTRARLSRIAILDGLWEVFSMPAEVARNDASSAGLTSTDDGYHYHCVILDSASWTKRANLCDTVVIGGALDVSRMKAGISVAVETEEECDDVSDMHVMACFWVV